MNQTDKRSIRFRLAEYKKNLLEEYNKAVILLNGDLERLISEGKEKELASKLVAGMQALFNDVKFIFSTVNPDFVTEDKMTDGDWRYTKLKPCPKCKQQPIFDAEQCEIRCEDCGVYYSAGTLDELVTGWNEYISHQQEPLFFGVRDRI